MKHSTLQQIYSDAIQKNPDSEIWLSLLSFEKIMLTNIDGINKYPESTEKSSINSASKVLTKFINNELSEKQVINFTEAALIKYFKPKYNIEYKDTFPKPSHTSYKECYDLGVNSVAIELNTKCIKTRFYTELMERDYIHLGSFTMEGRDQRISMFDICDNSFERKNLNIKVE